MYAGGLLATLLILGLLLLIISLVVLISEPRHVGGPSAREHPADITRRLRRQAGRERAGRGGNARG